MNLITIVNAVAPKYESIIKEVQELKQSNPYSSREELANIYGDRIKKKYTSVGVASALPSVIPGIGTAVQIGTEIATLSGDLALMLRWMAANCYGIALIYGKNIENEFNEEFIRILGIWCGVLIPIKVGAVKIGTKVAIVQFNKQVSGKILQRINQKVGTTIVTKYGTKRGGIALGKLIPFGVGAAIGGGFNYFTMSGFKKAAIKYYHSKDEVEYAFYEEI